MLQFAALLMGLYLAVPATGIVISMLGAAGIALPAPVCVLILLICTPAGAWSVLRGAASLERLIYNGCRIGIVGWLLAIAVFTVHRYSETKTSVFSEVPFLFAVFNPIMAQANVLICIVGRLLTGKSRSTTGPGAANVSEAKRAPGPDPTRTVRIVTIELILGSAVAALIIWVRSIDGWAGFGVMLLAYPVIMLYLAILVVGLVQGVRLLQGGRHRGLGALAVIISVAPLMLAGVLLVTDRAIDERNVEAAIADSNKWYRRDTWVEMRHDDASAAEPGETNPRVVQALQSPQLLQYAYVEGDEIVLVLARDECAPADSLQVRMAFSPVWSPLHARSFSRYCNESLAGEEVVVHMPDESAPLKENAWVSYQGKRIDTKWKQIADNDALNGQRLRRVASLMAPGSEEKPRIAEQLRPIADQDGSNLLDDGETQALERAIEFGLEAARLISLGATRTLVAKQTGVTIEDLDSRAREYNTFASQIEEADIMDLPTVVLPDSD